jgi:hypothetical protein
MRKWFTWVIVASKDTNAHLVQAHVCFELTQMALPHPSSLEFVPLLPAPCIGHISSHACITILSRRTTIITLHDFKQVTVPLFIKATFPNIFTYE